jgi:CP family cyanate transporter-like MFS transporter
VVGLALALRSPISSLAVVLPEARDNLSLSGSMTSLLTALPVLCFAVVGLWLGPRLGRFGLHRAAVVVLAVMTVGVVVRAFAPTGGVLLASTLLILAAIAVGNVLVPAVAKAHFPQQIALVSSIFGAAIIGGSTLGALQGGWTEAAWGWRAALAGVAVLLGLMLLVWLPFLVHDRKAVPPRSDLTLRQIAGVGAVWPLVVCFGLVSAQAYAQLGWYPATLRDAGLSSTEAAGAFAVLTGVGIPTMLCLAALTRLLGDRVAIALFAAATAAGWLGLLWSPTTVTWLWSALIGFGAGSFAWTMAMLARHTETPASTAALSSFVQGVGFIFAAVGPFGVGLLHDATREWTAALWLLVATGFGLGVAGVLAARPWSLEQLLGHDLEPSGSSSEERNQSVESTDSVRPPCVT